jgi:hypothetical protein
VCGEKIRMVAEGACPAKLAGIPLSGDTVRI